MCLPIRAMVVRVRISRLPCWFATVMRADRGCRAMGFGGWNGYLRARFEGGAMGSQGDHCRDAPSVGVPATDEIDVRAH